MTDNIPPEIADEGSAPAPVRISPEVRKLILECLEDAAANWVGGSTINDAIAFVEALP